MKEEVGDRVRSQHEPLLLIEAGVPCLRSHAIVFGVIGVREWWPLLSADPARGVSGLTFYWVKMVSDVSDCLIGEVEKCGSIGRLSVLSCRWGI